jgi:hypothetical protein
MRPGGAAGVVGDQEPVKLLQGQDQDQVRGTGSQGAEEPARLVPLSGPVPGLDGNALGPSPATAAPWGIDPDLVVCRGRPLGHRLFAIGMVAIAEDDDCQRGGDDGQHGYATHLAHKKALAPTEDPVDDLRAGWEQNISFALANPSLYALIWGEPRPGAPMAAAEESYKSLRDSIHRVAQSVQKIQKHQPERTRALAPPAQFTASSGRPRPRSFPAA